MRAYILDLDYKIVGEVEKVNKLSLTQKFYEGDSFSITVPYDSRYIKWLKMDYGVYLPDLNGFYGIIKTITVNTESGDLITFGGAGPEADIGDRILWNTRLKISNRTYESVLRQIVTDQVIDPIVPNRMNNHIALASSHGYTETVSLEKSFENCLTVIEALCAEAEIGYVWTYDAANKLCKLDFKKGTNRTMSQSTNKRAVFSREVKNVLSQEWVRSNETYSTDAFIAGAGEDDSRIISQYLTSNAGRKRKEIYVDARDISKDDDTDLDDYRALLLQRGKEKIAECVEVNTLSGQYFLTDQLKSWIRLGDYCTIYDAKWGLQADMQLTSITYDWSKESMTTTLGFGTGVPNLLKKIKKL